MLRSQKYGLLNIAPPREANIFFKVFGITFCSLFFYANVIKADKLRSVEINRAYPQDWSHLPQHTPTSANPSNYVFVVKTKLGRWIWENPAEYLLLEFSYEFYNDNTKHVIKGDDINNYIDISDVKIPVPEYFKLVKRGKYADNFNREPIKHGSTVFESYTLNTVLDVNQAKHIDFKEAYYTDQINKYHLKIKVKARFSGEAKESNEYIIQPMELNASVVTSDNNCSNTIKTTLTTLATQSWTSSVERNVFYYGATEALYKPPSLIKIHQTKQLDAAIVYIPISKNYLTNPTDSRTLQILAYEPGFLPARSQELRMPKASGLSIKSAKYDQMQNSLAVTLVIP